MAQIETKEVWCVKPHLYHYDGCPLVYANPFYVIRDLLGKEGWWYAGAMPLAPGETTERHFFQREVK